MTYFIDQPKHSLAAILVSQNTSLVIENIKMPENLFAGQVLVKLHVSGICGSQIGEIKGSKGKDKYLPHLLVHEGSATVIQTGPGVKYVKKGDLVVLHWRKGLGIDSDPPVYQWRGEKLNAGWVTTFNDYAVVSENRCTKIPSTTNHEIAALCGCAITTGFGVIENNANVKPGESVVIFGAGGIGLNIIQAASLTSAWPIIAIDLFDSRLALAKKFGATSIINVSNIDAAASINKELKGKQLDVFIDNTGLPEIIELGYKITDKDGRIVLVGVPKIGDDIKIHSLPLHFGKSITGSHGGESKPEKDIPRYLSLINNKSLKLEQLISIRYPLNKINDAIQAMQNGNTAGRVLISF